MHFQHPELLYLLFFLIIPLLVHLFRLRKFRREYFTNVKFLKKVVQETRQSSQIKKILVLITRMLLVASLVFAFAQPYLPASEKALKENKTLIYLDNSFSMQAPQSQVDLLKNSIDQLMEEITPGREYHFFTNTSQPRDLSSSVLLRELQEIGFSEQQLTYSDVQLKAAEYFKKFPQAEKDLILISDFQESMKIPDEVESESFRTHFIQKTADDFTNISLDSAYIESSSPETIDLKLFVNSNGTVEEPITVSVYNGTKLLGRNTLTGLKEGFAHISFSLQNEKVEEGRFEIEDSGLGYDNSLYFSINEPQVIKTVVISGTEDDFLKRIYTAPEFELSTFRKEQIDFNKLNAANLVILNEVRNFSTSLLGNLKNLKDKEVSIIIIPAMESQDHSKLLNEMGLPLLKEKSEIERAVTTIQYDHPLFQGVFENRTQNFEYPTVKRSYPVNSPDAILTYEDGRAFLLGDKTLYLYSAALNTANSNFINSPLVVPIFYQIGLNSHKKPNLYYEIGKENNIDISVNLGKDEVLKLHHQENVFIPRQQNFNERIRLYMSNTGLEAGNYKVLKGATPLAHLSFNHGRKESDLVFSDLSQMSNLNTYDSIESFFSESNAGLQIRALWKWFVIFALIFLLIEMLLIKFFK